MLSLDGLYSQDLGSCRHGIKALGGWRFGSIVDGVQAEILLLPAHYSTQTSCFTQSTSISQFIVMGESFILAKFKIAKSGSG
jgi:hypothetical protein